MVELADDRECLHDVLGWREVVGLGGEFGDNLALFVDDEGGAGKEAVVDGDAANVFCAVHGGEDIYAVFFADAGAGVGGDGELAGAVFGVGGELVEALDAVLRYANDGGSSSGEFVLVLSEGVGLEVAAAGEGGGVEVDDDGALFQGFAEREMKVFACHGGRGGKDGRFGAGLEGGEGVGAAYGKDDRQGEGEISLHEDAPCWLRLGGVSAALQQKRREDKRIAERGEGCLRESKSGFCASSEARSECRSLTGFAEACRGLA